MQRRIAALVAAAVAVLGAVVVLVFRVKAEPDVAVSDQALREAQASFERASRAPAPPSTPAIPPPTLRSPEPEAPGEGESAARVGESERRIPRVPPTMASGLRREGRDRGESGTPPDLPPDASPDLVQKRNVVSEAYDHGDFEAAFRASEDFLHQQPDNDYVKRVAAVSACALGDQNAALKHYQEATEANKRIIKLRCHRYGVEL
jgi:hypothetical protein